jgi:predicted RNA-binding protein with PUA domain
MKINELISTFSIFTSNEEAELLERITQPAMLRSFTERDQTIITNLIRKSLVSKVLHNNEVIVVPNESDIN